MWGIRLVLACTDIPLKGCSEFALAAVRTTLKYRKSLILPDRSRGISWPAPATIAPLTVPRVGTADGHRKAGISTPLEHLSLLSRCAEQARQYVELWGVANRAEGMGVPSEATTV